MLRLTNRPSTVPQPLPRCPPHDRGFRHFDPAEAQRIQGLYSHSKKRATTTLLNDISVTYSGTKMDAEKYFEAVFAKKHCNTNLLLETLKSDVPDASDDKSTKDLTWKQAVTALCSSGLEAGRYVRTLATFNQLV